MRFCLLLYTTLLVFSLDAQQWTEAEGAFGFSRIDDITFVNNELGFAVSGGGRVYRTTDGGLDWDVVLNLAGDNYFRAVEFLDENTGFATLLSGQIYRTDDGGDTWSIMSIPGLNTAICGLEHIGDTIWGAGIFAFPATLIKSTDRGENWTVSSLDSLADGLVEVYFKDANTGFIGGISDAEGGKILRTDDGGSSWRTVFTSEVAAEYVWKIYPLGPDTLYASVENLFSPRTSIACSYDGGESWTEKLVLSALLDIQGIGFLDGQRGWVGPRNFNGYYTEDGGNSWVQDLNFPPNVNRVTTRPDGTLFASGSGIFYYEAPQDTMVSSSTNFEVYPATSSIEVFPNPVSDRLNYSITIKQATNYRLDILGADGVRLAQLGSGRLTTGTHTGTYEIPEHFPSGPLFIVLRCDDNMVASEVARAN